MTIKLINKGQLFHCFQPIYNIQNWTKVGYEGFLRSSHISNLKKTFITAKNEKQLYELDSLSIRLASLAYRSTRFSNRTVICL